MKRMGLFKAGMVAFASLGILIPTPALQAATAGSKDQAEGRAQAVIDVALGKGGTLHGQVLDAQARPLARAAVSIQQGDREIASLVTDPSGHFRVVGLHGGVYRIVAGQATGVYRLWAPDTAPPSARAGALVVPGDQQVLLGQDGRVLRFLRNPWVVAAIVTAAIAIPVAIHNADRDDCPNSN